MNWNKLSRTSGLTEAFIEEHAHKVNWQWISYFQILSEPFIEKFQDKVDWQSIFLSQSISFDFVKKHIQKNHIDYLKNNNNIHFTPNQWSELEELFNKSNIIEIKDNNVGINFKALKLYIKQKEG